MLIVAFVAMLATLLACEWLVTRKHARWQQRKFLRGLRQVAVLYIYGIQTALGLASEVRARVRHRKLRLGLAGNAYTGQDKTHETSISRMPDASITTRHLLYKKGAGTNSGGVVNASIAVLAAQTDVPLGVVPDNWSSVNDIGQPVGMIILGCGPSTVRMRANAAGLAVGDIVYGVAGGYVDKLTNLTGSSTAYQVGVIIDIPGQVTTAAQGDIIEVASDAPSKVST